MHKDEIKSKVEIYICNHARHEPGKEDCASRGSKELTDNLKKWAKSTHGKEIKVARSGCLGKCSEGIAIACYPQKKFLLEVTLQDEEEIKKGLEQALLKVE